MGFQEEDEKPRPEFAANAPYLEENPITGVSLVANPPASALFQVREPSFPKEVRLRRIAAGSGLILLMVTSPCPVKHYSLSSGLSRVGVYPCSDHLQNGRVHRAFQAQRHQIHGSYSSQHNWCNGG